MFKSKKTHGAEELRLEGTLGLDVRAISSDSIVGRFAVITSATMSLLLAMTFVLKCFEGKSAVLFVLATLCSFAFFGVLLATLVLIGVVFLKFKKCKMEYSCTLLQDFKFVSTKKARTEVTAFIIIDMVVSVLIFVLSILIASVVGAIFFMMGANEWVGLITFSICLALACLIVSRLSFNFLMSHCLYFSILEKYETDSDFRWRVDNHVLGEKISVDLLIK